MSIQSYVRAHRAIYEHTELHKSTQSFTRAHRATYEHTELHISTQSNTRAHRASHTGAYRMELDMSKQGFTRKDCVKFQTNPF